MELLRAMDTSASALTAQRLRMEVAAANLANAESTRTPEGGPYRRRVVRLGERDPLPPRGESWGRSLALAAGMPARAQAAGGGGGTRVLSIGEDGTPLRKEYRPGHPDADASGYVLMPNVNPALEMVELIAASRAYEASLAALETTKSMVQRTLDLGRR
ncbi:MAG: flagellar basal body rod protein FlgC [Bacillota bacterium]